MKQQLPVHGSSCTRLFVILFVSLLLCGTSLMAATDIWNGGGAPIGYWSVGANWGGTAPNATGDNLIFSGSTQPLTTNDIPVTGVSWVQLNPSVPFTISGHPMTMTGGLTNLAQNNTWNVSLTNMNLNNSPTIEVDGTSVLTINTNITGTAAYRMAKTGSGTLVLGGTTANSDTAFSVSAGTLILNKASVNALAGSSELVTNGGLLQFSGTGTNQISSGSPVIVTNGGELDINGQTEYLDELIIGGTGINGTALTNSSSSSATIGYAFGSEAVGAPGSVTVGGGGNITIAAKGSWLGGTVTKVGTNTFTFAAGAGDRNTITYICNDGTLVLASSSTAFSTATGNGAYAAEALTVNSNSMVQLGGDGSGYEICSVASPVVNSGGVLDMNGEPQTFISSAGLTINGTGINGSGALINSSATAATLSGSNSTAITLGSPSSIGGNGSLTIAGAVAGSPSLTKVGTGALTLITNNTYSGNTFISAGALALSGYGSVSNSPIITVASNAVFDVSGVNSPFNLGSADTLEGGGGVNGNVSVSSGSIVPGTSTTLGTLTFSNNLILNGAFLLDNFNLSGNDSQVAVVGNVINNGTVTITLNYRSLMAGTYTLMTYGALSGSGTFQLDTTYPNVTLNSPGANALTITVGTSGSTSSASLLWKGDGVANVWDTSTANWLLFGASVAFNQGDIVTFDDTGSSTPAIDLTTMLSPASVVVNTTTNSYTFSGKGSLAGTGSLIMNGASVLTLTTANSYTGGTTVNAGTVQLGNGGASGDAGLGTITLNRGGASSNGANASLAINRAGTTVFGNPLSLSVGNQAIYVNSGQTAVFTNSISGGGQIWANGPGLLVISNFGASYTFTGGVVLANSSLGGLSFDSLNELRGGTIKGIYFASVGGSLIYTGPSDSDNYLFGFPALFQGGTNVINIANPSTTLTINDVILGTTAGAFVKAGPGTMVLNAANSYTTSTIISNGVLVVGADATAGYGSVTVCSNAVLAGAGVVFSNVIVRAGGIVQGGDTSYSGTLTLVPPGPVNPSLSLGPTNGLAVPTYSRFTIATGGQIFTPVLNVNGTNTILIQDNTLSVGTNTLISYGSINYTAGSGFQLGPLPAGVTANVLDTGSAIQLAVTAVSAPAPVFSGVTLLPGNNFQLTFTGSEGQGYSILASTNLALPLAEWATIGTGTFGSSPVTFVDSNAPNYSQRFYIIVSP